MKKIKKDFWYYLLVFAIVFLFVNLVLYSRPNELDQENIFASQGKLYRIIATATYTPDVTVSDILLVDESVGVTTAIASPVKKLNEGIAGYNILPVVQSFTDRYTVTWINYSPGHEQLCFYDSSVDRSKILVSGGFKFIHPAVQYVSADPGGAPEGMVFAANNSSNDDLFYYSLTTGELKKITRTPDGEKTFQVSMVPGQSYILIETETLYHRYQYRLQLDNLAVITIFRDKIPRHVIHPPVNWSREALNTYLAYGDSITWGKMRMNNLPYDPDKEYHHPEFAYPQKMLETLKQDYDYQEVYYISDGVPGADTFMRAGEIDAVLAVTDAKYLLIMLGTNDAFRDWSKPNIGYSLDGCLENLGYIVDTALSKNMLVIISTIPPRNDEYDTLLVRSQINALNAGIIDLAASKGIRYIDTHSTFMNYYPPDGWKLLLEDRDSSDIYVPGKGGQHPSPLGHEKIAELFTGELLYFAPSIPVNVTATRPTQNYIKISWPQNYEFDFNHYIVKFGYFQGDFNRSLTTTATECIFIRPPFLNSYKPQLYVKIQAVDDFGNKSSSSTPVSISFE